MIRTLSALLAVVGFAASAAAQPGNLPLSPGVRPASPIGPGMPARPGIVYFPAVAPGGYPMYGPWIGYGYPFGGYAPFYAPPVQPQVVTPPAPPAVVVVPANEFPATLSLQFPAAAEVWLNGKPAKGEASEERVLTSPVLKPGETFTFSVRATWEQGGKTYESTHTVTLGPGDRCRLLVVSGTEVK